MDKKIKNSQNTDLQKSLQTKGLQVFKDNSYYSQIEQFESKASPIIEQKRLEREQAERERLERQRQANIEYQKMMEERRAKRQQEQQQKEQEKPKNEPPPPPSSPSPF